MIFARSISHLSLPGEFIALGCLDGDDPDSILLFYSLESSRMDPSPTLYSLPRKTPSPSPTPAKEGCGWRRSIGNSHCPKQEVHAASQ